MSRITKEEIEKTKCGRFLLSDENIYLSIYSLNSYVFEYNLLNTEDRILYHRLQDKFDARLINGVITRVREQIIELFDKDKYIEAKVYFKPKKLSENGELEFRPLHSTGLITQIAIVSMLHLFVYEIPEEEEGDPKLRLSNLSRLIPSDFYGNRVSVKPEYLFKPWKQQYQKYNQNSNDALMKYHTSLEYKYEVTLDLENFFPTINPIIIYRYIINHLPAYLNDEERKMMKRVLQKLLFCKLTTTFDEKTAGQYYKVTKGAGNYDNVDKIEQNEKECWAFKEKSDKFVRGIPQGLPQSYFLGNIYMISIAEIFRKKFTGVSYFYVDDSVIFTNDVREDNFKEQLKELNKQIADEANNFEEDSAIYPEGTEKFYKSDLYGVNVHLDGKSNYTRLDNLDDSEVYLKCISREMSQAGSDFFRMYSDEENRNLEEKLDVLSKQVKAKRDQLVEEKSQKRDSGNEDAIEKDEDDTQKFEKRLTRYGVKGESHTSVIFVASDNGNTPNVRMYPFFELWSELEFSLPQFEELFYSYKKIIEEVEKELGMKVSKLTAETHNKNEKNKTILSKYSKQVLEKYQGNLLFEALCKEDFIAYLKKPNVKNVQKIFKITEIEGILTAYKLFYVGCSRARKNLIIIVEKNKIMNFKEKFVDKAKKIGFTVLS